MAEVAGIAMLACLAVNTIIGVSQSTGLFATFARWWRRSGMCTVQIPVALNGNINVVLAKILNKVSNKLQYRTLMTIPSNEGQIVLNLPQVNTDTMIVTSYGNLFVRLDSPDDRTLTGYELSCPEQYPWMINLFLIDMMMKIGVKKEEISEKICEWDLQALIMAYQTFSKPIGTDPAPIANELFPDYYTRTKGYHVAVYEKIRLVEEEKKLHVQNQQQKAIPVQNQQQIPMVQVAKPNPDVNASDKQPLLVAS